MIFRPSNRLARRLGPVVSALWISFLVWTVMVAGVWLWGAEMVASIPNPGWRAAAALILQIADPVWLVLASANLYLHLAETEGLARARIVALTIAVTAGALAASSAWTGYPLGSVAYTTRLGMKLGPVPVGWPLLWFVVIVSSRCLVARLLPRTSHAGVAVVAGGVALLTSFNLEPIATKLRLYWFWYAAGTPLPSPPLWRNYACWFLASAALTWLIREQKLATPAAQAWRPALVIVLVNLLLILGHARAAIGG